MKPNTYWHKGKRRTAMELHNLFPNVPYQTLNRRLKVMSVRAAVTAKVKTYEKLAEGESALDRRRTITANDTHSQRRNKYIKTKYSGLSLEIYEKHLKKINNACEICQLVPTENERPLVIDYLEWYDRENGECRHKIRGLLCYACYMGVRSFHNNTAALQRATNYIIARTPPNYTPEIDNIITPEQIQTVFVKE